MSPRRSLAALCLLALALSATGAQAARDEVDLVSRAAGAGGAKGNSSSNVPALSGDGRLVAFDSFATNLHPDDVEAIRDVFVRDVQTNATTLVSRASGATGAKGNSHSLAAATSADGRYVAFESLATNLHPSDGDAVRDVFVRDLQANTTTLVSRATGATGAKGNGMSLRAAVSGNGRFVAFESTASNLDPADTDTGRDVFVRDLTTSTTTLVSRASGVTGVRANGESFMPAVTDDGFVVFQSPATNLSPSDGDAIMDVFARDLGGATTTLVSRAGNGVKGNSGSYSPAVSGDGRLVAFESTASNLDPSDTDAGRDVFVKDRTTAVITLVSRSSGVAGGKGNDASERATLSSDGRFVAFESLASNLHSDDADTTRDVFVRNLATNATTLASRAGGASGAKGNGDSAEPALSADGAFIAFQSGASNLHPDAGDLQTADVFRRQLLGNTRPAAAEDAYATTENTPLTVTAPGVLANDSDPDEDPLNAQLVSGPAHGALVLSANGSFTYTPAGGYVGADSFAYRVNDGSLDSNTATAAITVSAAPPPPPPPPPAPSPPPPLPPPSPPAPKPLCQGRPATIVGTAGNDDLRGTKGADVIVARGGNDLVRGLGGADLVCAAAGSDLLLGGPGNDRLYGGPGADTMRGGPGKDRMIGGPGRDRSSQ